MAQQVKKKFIGNDQVDGSKIKLLHGQTLRGTDALGNEIDILANIQTEIDQAQTDSQSYTDQKIADLVDSAPALLDTLNELAAAIGDDPNFVTTVVNQVATVQSNLDQEILDRQADVNAEESRALAAEGVIASNLAQEILDRQADVDAEEARALLAEADLQDQIDAITGSSITGVQSELDATQVGAGLNPDGSYTVSNNGFQSFIAGTTSLKGSIDALDNSLIIQSNALGQEMIDRENADLAIQSEIDNTQVGAGLETDGSYSVPVGSNYLGSAVSLKDADSQLDAQIKVVEDDLAQEILDRIADVDAEESRAMGVESSLQSQITQEISDRQADVDAEQSRAEGVEASLQSQITQEISDRISDVNAEESRALAAEGVLQSNIDSEESARISADNALDSRLDVLESVVWFKQKFVLTNTDISNGFVTLSHTPESNSMSAFVDRLAIHEGASEDYTISGTTMTFLNDLVSPGQQSLSVGDTVYVKYQYKM